MATETRSGRCEGRHQRTRFVDVIGDEPTPPWPEAEKGGRCVCGAELKFVTNVDRFIP